MSQSTDMVTSRDGQFILLPTPRSEGTLREPVYMAVSLLKFHNNINKTESFSL